MKNLIWKLIIPLTLISFVIFKKWWFVFPDDAPDSMMSGFPLPYVCDAWFTSMSNQFFVLELTFDLLIYFSFWFLIVFSVNRFLTPIKIPNIIAVVLVVINLIILSASIFIASQSESVFEIRREFEVDVKETGYNFIWENTPRPDAEKYYKKNN
jgi:hypothetical protein